MGKVAIQSTVDCNPNLTPIERQVAFIEERCKRPITSSRYYELMKVYYEHDARTCSMLISDPVYNGKIKRNE